MAIQQVQNIKGHVWIVHRPTVLKSGYFHKTYKHQISMFLNLYTNSINTLKLLIKILYNIEEANVLLTYILICWPL